MHWMFYGLSALFNYYNKKICEWKNYLSIVNNNIYDDNGHNNDDNGHNDDDNDDNNDDDNNDG